MDDGGSPSVEEVEPFEDLSTPASQHFDFHHLEPFQISTRKKDHHFCLVRNTEITMHCTKKYICLTIS